MQSADAAAQRSVIVPPRPSNNSWRRPVSDRASQSVSRSIGRYADVHVCSNIAISSLNALSSIYQLTTSRKFDLGAKQHPTCHDSIKAECLRRHHDGSSLAAAATDGERLRERDRVHSITISQLTSSSSSIISHCQSNKKKQEEEEDNKDEENYDYETSCRTLLPLTPALATDY